MNRTFIGRAFLRATSRQSPAGIIPAGLSALALGLALLLLRLART